MHASPHQTILGDTNNFDGTPLVRSGMNVASSGNAGCVMSYEQFYLRRSFVMIIKVSDSTSGILASHACVERPAPRKDMQPVNIIYASP